MLVEYTCTHEGCDVTVRTKPRDRDSQETRDELAAHLAEVHGGTGTYGVRERRRWVIPLAVANLVAVAVSALVTALQAFGEGGGPLLLLGILFPQVWGTGLIPALGIGIMLGAALLGSLVALLRPRGLRLQTFFAAITAIGIVVWLAVPIITFIFLAVLSATWPS